jgi:hypothetical protein
MPHGRGMSRKLKKVNPLRSLYKISQDFYKNFLSRLFSYILYVFILAGMCIYIPLLLVIDITLSRPILGGICYPICPNI